MKNVRKICHYAQQMRIVCDSIENWAVNAESCPDEDADPLAVQLMLNQLEQAQQLILGLTQNIMEAVDDDDTQNAADPTDMTKPDLTDVTGVKLSSDGESNIDLYSQSDNATGISDKKKEDT